MFNHEVVNLEKPRHAVCHDSSIHPVYGRHDVNRFENDRRRGFRASVAALNRLNGSVRDWRLSVVIAKQEAQDYVCIQQC
jgi:hypothetical protein